MGGRECCKYFEDFAMGEDGTEASFAQWRTMCQSKCLVHLCKFRKKEMYVYCHWVFCTIVWKLYETTLPSPPSVTTNTHTHTSTHIQCIQACILLVDIYIHTHTHAQTERHTTLEPSASFNFWCDGTAQFTRENGMDAQNLPNTDIEPKQLAIAYILQTLSQTSFFSMWKLNCVRQLAQAGKLPTMANVYSETGKLGTWPFLTDDATLHFDKQRILVLCCFWGPPPPPPSMGEILPVP